MIELIEKAQITKTDVTHDAIANFAAAQWGMIFADDVLPKEAADEVIMLARTQGPARVTRRWTNTH